MRGVDVSAGCTLCVHGFLAFSVIGLFACNVRGFPITFGINLDQPVRVRRLM